MRVLLSPRADETVLIAGDFVPARDGQVLTFLGEPCARHESAEEIALHGCGRAFLGLETGQWCSVGIVAEMATDAVRLIMRQGAYARRGLGEENGVDDPTAPEAEGSLTMISMLTGVIWGDLEEIGTALQRARLGSIFGVRNTGTGSRLIRRAWAEGRAPGTRYSQSVGRRNG